MYSKTFCGKNSSQVSSINSRLAGTSAELILIEKFVKIAARYLYKSADSTSITLNLIERKLNYESMLDNIDTVKNAG